MALAVSIYLLPGSIFSTSKCGYSTFINYSFNPPDDMTIIYLLSHLNMIATRRITLHFKYSLLKMKAKLSVKQPKLSYKAPWIALFADMKINPLQTEPFQPHVGGKEYYYLLNHVEITIEYKNMNDGGSGRVVAVKIKPTSWVL